MSGNNASENLHILQFFSRSVRTILELKGLKQSHLARGIGADPTNVSRWLSCKAVPNAVWVAKMADYLKVSTDELYGRQPPGRDPLPEIREHAREILSLAGGITNGPKKKKKTAAKKRKTR